MKPDDQVYRWMTPCPESIGRDATVHEAKAVMRRHGFHHLPVMDEGQLVGIVSDRDLAVAERLRDPRATLLGDIMTKEPYVTVPYAPLAEVAHAMAKGQIGSALVIDKGNVVGVFTVTDALRALSEGFEPQGSGGRPTP